MTWFVLIRKNRITRKVRVKIVRKKRDYQPHPSKWTKVEIIGVFSYELYARLVAAEFKDQKLKGWENQSILTDRTVYTFARDPRGQRVFCDG